MANPKMFQIILLASYGGFVGAMHAPHQQAKQKQIIEAGEPSKNEPSLKSKFYHVSDYILEAIPPSNGEMIAELSTYAVDYCHTVGNVALWQDPPRPIDLAIVQPISLLPSPFPRELFEKAKSIQKFVNELYFRVSLDHTFLLNAYKDLVEADPWIKRQVELMEKVRLHIKQSNDARPKMTLIFNRADYFTHQVRKGDKISLKQVEVNISQLGGPGDGNSTSDLHEQMLRKVQLLRYGKPATMASGEYPKNSSRTGMAQAMLAAWNAYMEEYKHEQLDKAVIVFLFDKELIGVVYFEELQWMQFELERLAMKEGLYVNVVRVTIPESPDRIKLNEKDGHLYLDGDRRVALVHMVVGLLPHHWEGEKVWNTRYEMEISSAILSPNIRAQLAGTKRIQQLLAQTENLKRFFGPNEKDKIVALKETFVELWGLEKDDPATEAKIKEAIANPNEFVLKAQLGGGKGNFFGEELKEMLEKMDATKRSAYTLMQRIHPIVVKNYMKKQLKMVEGEDGEMKEQPSPIATLADVNTELSFFGTYLGKADFDKNDARGQLKIFNRTDGYFVRSKLSTSDQGGINEGHGVLDSVLLFDEEKFYEDGHNHEFSDKERKQG